MRAEGALERQNIARQLEKYAPLHLSLALGHALSQQRPAGDQQM
jgi:hypothetical protein